MKSLSLYKTLFLTGLISLVLFYPFLGHVHLFDWDEINFAEAAREMIITGNFLDVQVNYEPFWEKPPLFIWLQVISMKLFGINEFAARFPNAVCGSISLMLFVWIGKRLKNLNFGIFWALLYASSLLPQLYFKSGIIDPWFNLFIFTGIWLAIEYLNSYKNQKEKLKYIMLSGAAIGLAILTKGPVALLIFLLVASIYWAAEKFKLSFSLKAIGAFLFALTLVGGSWFIFQILSGRLDVVLDFIKYQIRLAQIQDSGHGGPFFYHWIILLIGCFPLSLIAIGKLLKIKHEGSIAGRFRFVMIILFWTVLFIFSLVETKIIHYSSLCYFPLSFLAAEYLSETYNSKPKKWLTTIIISLGSLLILVFTVIPIFGFNIKRILNSGIIKDPFAEANLSADVSWGIIDFSPAFFILFALIGFIFFQQSKRWYVFLTGSLISFSLLSVIIIPKIEMISQNAAIEFYKSKQNEDCYVDTYHFSSYADLFYTLKQPSNDKMHTNKGHLLIGAPDKPVYIVVKIHDREQFENEIPNFKFLYGKNGFLFYKRTDI